MKTKIGVITGIIGAVTAAEIGAWIIFGLSLISALCSAAIGIWNMIEKFKKAKVDGNISDEEKKDILSEIDKITEDVKNKIK